MQAYRNLGKKMKLVFSLVEHDLLSLLACEYLKESVAQL